MWIPIRPRNPIDLGWNNPIKSIPQGVCWTSPLGRDPLWSPVGPFQRRPTSRVKVPSKSWKSRSPNEWTPAMRRPWGPCPWRFWSWRKWVKWVDRELGEFGQKTKGGTSTSGEKNSLFCWSWILEELGWQREANMGFTMKIWKLTMISQQHVGGLWNIRFRQQNLGLANTTYGFMH